MDSIFMLCFIVFLLVFLVVICVVYGVDLCDFENFMELVDD